MAEGQATDEDGGVVRQDRLERVTDRTLKGTTWLVGGFGLGAVLDHAGVVTGILEATAAGTLLLPLLLAACYLLGSIFDLGWRLTNE